MCQPDSATHPAAAPSSEPSHILVQHVSSHCTRAMHHENSRTPSSSTGSSSAPLASTTQTVLTSSNCSQTPAGLSCHKFVLTSAVPMSGVPPRPTGTNFDGTHSQQQFDAWGEKNSVAIARLWNSMLQISDNCMFLPTTREIWVLVRKISQLKVQPKSIIAMEENRKEVLLETSFTKSPATKTKGSKPCQQAKKPSQLDTPATGGEQKQYLMKKPRHTKKKC